MSYTTSCRPPHLIVRLRGIDRLLCGRSAIRIALADITDARVTDRRELESRLDHRVSGYGPHQGRKRRRVGTFMGRDVGGRRQFWAVPSAATEVVAIDLDHERFARLVLDPTTLGPEVRRALGIALDESPN